MNGLAKKIIQNEKTFKDEVDVKYLFFPSYKNSDLLTITFAGFHAEGDPPKYNYMRTLEEFDCNQLFILDDFGARGSYYMCVNRDFKIEKSVKKLIDTICQDHKIKKRISLGSSKGASAAIYYGLKYDYDAIIAGTPQYYIGSYLKKVKSAHNVLDFMAGNQSEDSIEFLDNIIENLINQREECSTQVVICAGKDDPHYQFHSVPLIDTLEQKNVPFVLDVLNYSAHSDIGKVFPDSIKKNLALYGTFSILEDYSITVEKNLINLSLITTNDTDKVAVYLYVDKKRGKGKKLVERIGYNLEKEYSFNVEEQRIYTLKVFVTGKEKRRFTTLLPPIATVKSIPHLTQRDKRIQTVTGIKRNTVQIANQILANQFYFSKSMDIIDFSPTIDWNYQHNKNKNSYQLYLHALHSLSYLTNAFEETGDLRYLEKGKQILTSWRKYEATNPENMFLWYDHSVANRTQTLIYYYLIAKDYVYLEENEYRKLLERHAEYLMEDENYRKNNHGIMMDKALIMLGIVFDVDDSKGYTQKGLQRLRDCFHHSFSYKGVHLENSPEYHAFVHKMLLSIEQYLNENGLSLGESVIAGFELIDGYYRYITKPDGKFPMIGDTKDMKSPKPEKKYDAFCDQIAGIVIFQSENLEDASKSTWMSFVCGFGTLTHKHFDDLSFTLAYKGKDIFIDSGKYGYGSSPERKYLRSPLAHSIITVANQHKYSQDEEGKEGDDEISITTFTDNKVYSHVKGINNAYKNVKIERSIFFFKPDLFVIVDKALSTNDKKHTFLQNFNLDPHIIVESISDKVVELLSEQDKIIVEQNIQINDVKLHVADRDTPRAVISKKSAQLTDTNQIEFSKRGKKACFLTTISLGAGTRRNMSVEYKEKENTLTVSLDGKPISIIV